MSMSSVRLCSVNPLVHCEFALRCEKIAKIPDLEALLVCRIGCTDGKPSAEPFQPGEKKLLLPKQTGK
jgi:hypothetical protein